MNPLVTVVIPVYKVERYIHTCVDSVINQTYTNLEIILVDDGSPDRCPQICDEYALKDSRIKVIHKENGGLSSARNIALDQMHGQYVSFLDSDDFWHPNFVEVLLDLCLSHNCNIAQAGFVFGTETSFPTSNRQVHIDFEDNHSVFLKQKVRVLLCVKLYEASLWDGIRMPVGKINEDDFTTWKLYYRTTKIGITNQQLYYYTYNLAGISSTQRAVPRFDFLEAYEERIAFFQNNNEKELETESICRFCLALVLCGTGKHLSNEQRTNVNAIFLEQKSRLDKMKISTSRRLIFALYAAAPGFAGRCIRFIRNSRKGLRKI